MATEHMVALRRHRLLIDGAWTDAVGGGTHTIVSPATGEPVAEVAAAEAADVDRAVAAANRAFERERWSTMFSRAAMCERIAEVIEGRVDDMARTLSLEHGKPLAEADGEIRTAATGFRLAAGEARRLRGETIPVEDPSKRVMTFLQPRGVFAVLTPWNFPFNIPVEYVGPALASGNAVILKPAPTTAGIGALLADCIVEADVPTGLFNLLTGPSVEMSSALVSHPDLAGVGFTGSSAVGRIIAAQAIGKQLVLELGGNGPIVVLDDADEDVAVAAIGASAFWNAGQSCAAAERILASDRVSGRLVEGLTSYADGLTLAGPLDPGTTLGPVNNEAVAAKMDAHVKDAVGRGARVTTGGRRAQGYPTDLYYLPTVIDGVPLEADVQEDETFGPIAPVTSLGSDEEILAAANRSRHGLSSAVFTKDIDRAMWFAERMQTGQVVVNDTSNYWELHLPFGGWSGKSSGQGRVGGRYIFDAFTQIRSVAISVGQRDRD